MSASPGFEGPTHPKPARGLPAWASVLLVIAILAGGIGVAVALVKTRPQPKKEVEAAVAPLVEFERIEVKESPVSMQLTGEVMAAHRLVVMPEVNGRVVWQNPDLVPGGRVKKGSALVRIDGRDYALALQQQKAMLESQRVALTIEKARGKVAEREWDVFKKEREAAGLPVPQDPASEGHGSLALREPQLKGAEVAVSSAKSSVDRAQLALSKTTITAPFNAVVQAENVEIGQLVTPASQLATLVGTDELWVQVSIPVDKLSFVRLPNGDDPGSAAKVWAETGRDRIERDGRVLRLLSDLDPVGRLARLIVQIDDPYLLNENPASQGAGAPPKSAPPALPESPQRKVNSQLPLLLGSFVRVAIEGVEVSDVARVPRIALRDGDQLYTLTAENKLAIKTVTVVWGDDESALVTGSLKTGDRIVMTALPAPVEGMLLRPAEPEKEKAPEKAPEKESQK